ncbi:MAG: tetratricopeptide repeat protein, partial [Planctomycetota bacterium]
ARHLALVAELQFATGALDDALLTIERALTRAIDQDLRAELHERAAEAHLFSGRRAEAVACFERSAQEAPASGARQLEVARALARHGLTQAALDHYRQARELFAGDAQRTSRALAEQGALHELRLEGDAAVRCYLQADDLLARGHWLERDLRARLIDLHRRSGSLPRLIEHYREAVQAQPRELDAREALAGALVAARAFEEADAVLSRAVEDHPRDLQLARLRIDLARLAGDDAALVAELQRALDLGRPDRELRFELAQAFARQGRDAQARLQWERLKEAAPRDAELRARIGRAWASLGRAQEARAELEQAARLDPTSLGRHLELARHHVAAGRTDEALEVLEAADSVAVRTVGDLDRLADFHADRLDRERAADALERAVALTGPDPVDGRRLLRLGRLARKIGRSARAAEVLRALIDLERDTTLRDEALKEYVSLVPRGEARLRALRAEEAAIAAGVDSPAAYLIVSELRQLVGDRRGAQGALTQWLERRPDDLDARLALARSLEIGDQPELALEQVLELLDRFPRRRRTTLLRCVRLYEELGRGDEASAALGEVARGAVDNPAALRDAAAGYRRLGQREQAVELLERALRIDADNLAARRGLAALRRELGDAAGARAELERAYAVASFDQRPQLAKELLEGLGSGRNRREVCKDLELRAAANPYDTTSAFLAAELHLIDGMPEMALSALAPHAVVDSLDPYLLTLRARVHQSLRDHQSAVADLEVLLHLDGVDHGVVLATLMGVLLDADQETRALEVARQMEDPLDAARRLAGRGHEWDAAALLREALDAETVGTLGWRELGRLLGKIGEPEGATAAFETYLEAVPNDRAVLRDLGDLRFELDDIDGVLDVGHRLVMEDSDARGLETWFKTKGLLQDYMRMRGNLLMDHARDAEDVRLGLEALLRRREGAQVGIEVLEYLTGRDQPPAGQTPQRWELDLRSWRMAFYARDRRFGRARLKELRELLDDGELHPAWEWVEYADLLGLGIKIWRFDWKLMQRGLEQHPGAPRFLTLVGTHARNNQLHELDVRVLELLEAALSEPVTTAAVAEARRVTWEAHRNQVRRD